VEVVEKKFYSSPQQLISRLAKPWFPVDLLLDQSIDWQFAHKFPLKIHDIPIYCITGHFPISSDI